MLARNKKRKEPEDYTSNTLGMEPGPSAKKGKKGKNDKGAERKSKNTAVYVTGLPLDTEADEVIERFSRCGVIEEDDEGEPKVKLYAREDGTFSGEALVVYFKEESVMLALNILDDAELRIGEPSTRMTVQQAQFGHKHEAGSVEGSTNVTARKTVDKKKISRRIGKMQKCVCLILSLFILANLQLLLGKSMNGTMKTGLVLQSLKRTRLTKRTAQAV